VTARALFLILALAPATLHAQAEEQLRQAIRRYENLEIEQARILFQQVISPSSPFPVSEAQRVTALSYLGATLATLGQRDSALTYFIAAIERNPLVDLDPRRFSEQERQVFSEARRRVFRVGLQPVPRDTIDPRGSPATLTVATTHPGVVHVELVNTADETRYVLFEGDVDGPRNVPFNGFVPRSGDFVPAGAYDLVVIGESRLLRARRDSTSVLLEIQHLVTPLEDTLASFRPDELLPERRPTASAARDLLMGVGVATAALLSGPVVGKSALGGGAGLAVPVAAVGAGVGVWAFFYRRAHLEIPENIAVNAHRQAERAERNAEIMRRNADRVAATRIVLRPLGQ
jgi:hypothetical protein